MSPGPESLPDAKQFHTTHWSVVLAAGSQHTAQSANAFEALCRAYWYPIYAFVRRLGHSPQDAEDLTQEFFTHLLTTDALSNADPRRGRFRAFLLASVKNLMTQEWRKQHRQKRGGEFTVFSLEASDAEGRYQIEPTETLTPEKAYERRWAETLLARVLDRLRVECNGPERTHRFEVLKPFLVDPKDTVSYAESAPQLGLSEEAARAVVKRLRRRYRELFMDEIAHTVARPEEIHDEIQHLFAALA